jgi:hypothetical protein
VKKDFLNQNDLISLGNLHTKLYKEDFKFMISYIIHPHFNEIAFLRNNDFGTLMG